MHLELTEALIRELSQLLNGDRYPPSPRICGTEGDPRRDAAAGPRARPAPPPRDGITSRRAKADTGDEVSIR
jgi:hypothetical protein